MNSTHLPEVPAALLPELNQPHPGAADSDASYTPATSAPVRERILAYYAVATQDYRVWSRNYNMHFGYWRWGLNPFNRESMLQELNRQVVARLNLPAEGPARVADLGGGTGATARIIAACCPEVRVDVVTLVPTQVELGNRLKAAAPGGERITMHCADYTATGLPGGSFDAVCMIESACHAEGPTKAMLMREAHRLLKPGGTLLMIDAMLLRETPQGGLLNRIGLHFYRRWCECWAVPEMARIDLLPQALEPLGFTDYRTEDWSWRMVPSVAHVPLLAFYFMVVEIIKARGLLPVWRWRHIVASLLTPLLGLRRRTVVYAAVSARKRA